MTREEVSILVVDDVNTMREQIKQLLQSFGFKKVTLAGDGGEAQKILGSGSVHLVLCDWHMDPIDGLAVLKSMRGNATQKALPFVMITAESVKEKVVEAIQAGVDDYLVKPLTLEQIQNKVYGVLVKKKVLE